MQKKRRRSDRKKYQAEHGWGLDDYIHSRKYERFCRQYDRESRWYGQESLLPIPGRVLHVTGNSYRWEKA